MIAIVTPIFRVDGAYDLNAKAAFECSRNRGNAKLEQPVMQANASAAVHVHRQARQADDQS
jgi:hypothetical protein